MNNCKDKMSDEIIDPNTTPPEPAYALAGQESPGVTSPGSAQTETQLSNPEVPSPPFGEAMGRETPPACPSAKRVQNKSRDALLMSEMRRASRR